MANDNEPKRINLEYSGMSISFELSGSNVLEFYQHNPSRVQDILSGHICAAIGDIYSGEELDSIVNEINAEAQRKKISLLRSLNQAEQNQRN